MARIRCALAAAFGLFGLMISTAVVSAHAQYQSSSPPANATVSAAPATVQVTWTQELAAVQFTITAPDGANVVAGPGTIDLAQRHNATVQMKDAGPGQYVVLWHNVSGDDGDPNDGSFVFTVASKAAAAAASATPTPATAGAARAPDSTCVDTGQTTSGQADFRVNTYCKRQMIRDQYRGKINELVFNYDLSIGMGLESALKDAMRG